MKNFWNSLQFRIPTVFIVSFLLILVAIFAVFSTIGKNLLEKQAYKEVILSGQNIVSELGNRIALAESLATALANLGEKMPADDALAKRLVRRSSIVSLDTLSSEELGYVVASAFAEAAKTVRS